MIPQFTSLSANSFILSHIYENWGDFKVINVSNSDDKVPRATSYTIHVYTCLSLYVFAGASGLVDDLNTPNKHFKLLNVLRRQ